MPATGRGSRASARAITPSSAAQRTTDDTTQPLRLLDRLQILDQREQLSAHDLVVARALDDRLAELLAPDRHLARAVRRHVEASVDEARDLGVREGPTAPRR